MSTISWGKRRSEAAAARASSVLGVVLAIERVEPDETAGADAADADAAKSRSRATSACKYGASSCSLPPEKLLPLPDDVAALNVRISVTTPRRGSMTTTMAPGSASSATATSATLRTRHGTQDDGAHGPGQPLLAYAARNRALSRTTDGPKAIRPRTPVALLATLASTGTVAQRPSTIVGPAAVGVTGVPGSAATGAVSVDDAEACARGRRARPRIKTIGKKHVHLGRFPARLAHVRTPHTYGRRSVADFGEGSGAQPIERHLQLVGRQGIAHVQDRIPATTRTRTSPRCRFQGRGLRSEPKLARRVATRSRRRTRGCAIQTGRA